MRAFPDSRWRQPHQKRADQLRGLWRYGAALAIVAASTLVAEGFYRVFDTTRLSMVFLAGILITAVTLGAWPAYFAAAISFFLYNFYLVEPRFTFQLVSAEDVLVLVVFAAVAFLTGSLTGRIRDQARQSADRAHTTAALFEASRELSAADEEDLIRGRIAQHIAQAARGEALVWDAGRTWCAPIGLKPPPELLEALASAGGGEHLVGPWRIRPLRADGALLGVAAWRGPADQDAAPEDDPLVAVLADLGAAAVMRARLAAARSEIEAMARTEQLRNALLSSISHDLRTPLAAILASASSLKDFGERFSPEVRADLVTTIQEEAVRLNRFVANLLSMTRLESGALDLDRQTFGAAEVIDRVAVRFERPGQPIRRDLTDGGLLASGDPILLEQALGNVVENALRYGPAGAPVTIRAWRDDGAVHIEVEDQGRGVPPADLDRIFEKFYRSPGAATIQGTGLGLSIARGLVEAMDGSIAARARADGEPGLVVGLILTGSTPHAA
ncbi:DUF4118 domain-containing protein [Caulobacter sp. RHG1]|uniref:DUF4118 domain-containing protein n=1 Tax=Caulobacter sp. (strain RHG1) TaxID=2545762 RepID=UPI0019D61FD8|nr:DUF4118 domain-containing protein [Caulobacter sp. RHG1]NQE61723.1 Osmosensitive K+ channel histidine kinase KdpD [Caulobacter sp. RHG1]